jgi:hypothetical protein
MRVPLCPAVHGHIADSVRDHEPRPGGRRCRITRDEEAEAVTGSLAPGISGARHLLAESPLGPEDHWWPTWSGPRIAHEIHGRLRNLTDPACGDGHEKAAIDTAPLPCPEIRLTYGTRDQMGVDIGGGIDPVSPHCSMCYSAEVDLQQTGGPYAL